MSQMSQNSLETIVQGQRLIKNSEFRSLVQYLVTGLIPTEAKSLNGLYGEDLFKLASLKNRYTIIVDNMVENINTQGGWDFTVNTESDNQIYSQLDFIDIFRKVNAVSTIITRFNSWLNDYNSGVLQGTTDLNLKIKNPLGCKIQIGPSTAIHSNVIINNYQLRKELEIEDFNSLATETQDKLIGFGNANLLDIYQSFEASDLDGIKEALENQLKSLGIIEENFRLHEDMNHNVNYLAELDEQEKIEVTNLIKEGHLLIEVDFQIYEIVADSQDDTEAPEDLPSL